MDKRWVVRSASFAAAQVIVGGVVLFFLYGYLLRQLGPELMGVWAAVLGVSSISRISELGLSAGMVKFVSQYLSRHDHKSAGLAIQTALISVGALFAVVLFTFYPAVEWILRKAIPALMILPALEILPWALVSVWMLALAGILTGALDGCQRIDQRSWLTIASQLIYLALVMAMAPVYGLIGVAYAQLGQASMLLIFAWLILRRSVNGLPSIPWQWRFDVLRSMFGYGAKFQYTSVMSMLFDPVTKLLLSRFGGVASVSYYEMANRMVGQIRTLIVEANRVLVPMMARIDGQDTRRMAQVHETSYQLLFFVSLPLFSIIALFSPLISLVWIGRYQEQFILFSWLLSLGWVVNIMAGPAYFSNLATGNLRWNMIGHTVVGGLNLCLGWVFGLLWGGYGVVVAFVVALITGSLTILLAGRIQISSSQVGPLIPRPYRWHTFWTLGLLMSGGTILSINNRATALLEPSLVSAILAILIIAIFASHPHGRYLFRLLLDR